MGEMKSLASNEAIEKIKELAEGKACMFGTYVDGRIKTRPMSTQKVDEAGNVWFLSSKRSDKNAEIESGSEVDLFYAHGHDSFLSIHGTAEVSFDRAKIKELWQPLAKVWFTEGVDDPDISVIKVSIEEGYYWDNKHGELVQKALMVSALIAGKTHDDGVQGKLRV